MITDEERAAATVAIKAEAQTKIMALINDDPTGTLDQFAVHGMALRDAGISLYRHSRRGAGVTVDPQLVDEAGDRAKRLVDDLSLLSDRLLWVGEAEEAAELAVEVVAKLRQVLGEVLP